MGKSSVWTIEQFKKYTSGGLLAHRPKEFKQLDEMLAAYHKVTDPRRELAYLLTIWFRASTLLARRTVKARRRAGLATLETQVDTEIKRIHILAAQAGWRSTPGVLARVRRPAAPLRADAGAFPRPLGTG
jgi:hypothetical protein